ncbi:DUF502 domain-containing protein [Natrinema longum]|uniref:DUF502 domain-containing protein n=1 Tax=Natrinema longum TaxID=370324 RepID=A0A8A2U5D3_9EURY|nr:DUF502 domain-containing protein [Natrinema longum]MBZ6494686.1 DUF502 domain-containing protein [Natrinema longum]QSW84000.1 DUF502 domain-containing protein [Natrinema longum]
MAALVSRFQRLLINGVVITIPLVATLLVVLVVFDFILGVLSPIVSGVTYAWPDEPPVAVIQFATLLSVIGFFLVVGLVAEYTPGTYLSERVHATMETIPGVSTVYESVRRASRLLADDETDQFQEVKLVEFPHEGAYMLGFLTAETPAVVEDSAGEAGMVTIMVPLAPNPATNGYVMHMPAENVHEVDLTVEEAFRSIATLGVAADSLGGDG